MELYSLPKDILIKLISTIREDTIKEYDEKIKFIKEEFNHCISIEKCSFLNCDATLFLDKHINFPNCYKCYFMGCCKGCLKYYCNKHLKFDNGYYCIECKY